MREVVKRLVSLCNLPRTGWLLRGVPPSIAETVAEHTFLVATLALLISKELIKDGLRIDTGKLLTLALLHDVPEAIEGDIVKWVKDKVPSIDKLDLMALKELGLNEFNKELKELSELASIEAILIKLSDNLATYIQGLRYDDLGYKDVRDITNGCLKAINDYINLLPKDYAKVVNNVISTILGRKGLK